MKQKYLFLGCCAIALVLFSYGCQKEADNVVMSADGVEISFDQQGKGEPAIVFIHGWSNNTSVWNIPMSYLSEKYRVIAVDLPGFGKSGYNRTKWTMASFGEDVAAVIKKLNLKRVVLVGHSMGGPVIIEAAKTSPENIIGLVLVDVLQDVDMKYSPEMIAGAGSFMMELVTNPTTDKLTASGFCKKNPQAYYERVVAMLSANKNAARVGWEESIRDFFRWSNDDCIESLKEIQVPIISINSDMEPTNVEAFKKYVPSYQVKIIPDVGHVIWWDNPEEFNRMLEESIQEFANKSKPE